MRLIAVFLAACLLAGAAGCPTQDEAAPVVPTAVWTPCPTQVPAKPAFPAETLTGKEDVFTIGKTLYADIQARIAYEIDLRTRLEGCTASAAPTKP